MKIILNFALNCEFKIPMFSISIWRGACKYHKWINYCLKLVKHVWIQTLFLNLHFSSQGFLNHFLYAEFWVPSQLLRTYKRGIFLCMDYMFQSQKITTTTTTRSLPCIISMCNMQFIKQKREIYNQKLQKLWKTFVPPFAIKLSVSFSGKKRKSKWQEYL